MKTCIKCGETKPEASFPKGKNRCLSCLKQYRHDHYLKNKEKVDAQNKAYYETNRTDYLERSKEYYYSEMGKISALFNAAKRRAEKKKWDFNLTKEWILQRLQEQNYRCALTNIPLVIGQTKHYLNPHTPSLDRIDASKGYTMDNVRIVCLIINLSLNEFGEEVFKDMCKAYLRYNA